MSVFVSVVGVEEEVFLEDGGRMVTCNIRSMVVVFGVEVVVDLGL